MPGRIGSSPTPTRRDLPDPPVMRRDASEVKYARVDGDIFVDGARPSDVRQGELDNCYLLASLAAIAHQRPDFLPSRIRDNGDGTYSVLLFKKTFFGGAKPRTVTIDDQLPLRFGMLQRYGHSTTPDELWVGLFEKAYAGFKGGYEEIGNLGRASDALFALTGVKAKFVGFDRGTNASSVAADVRSRLERGELLVAASKNDATQVRAQHSYAITGIEDRNGQQFIVLHDPLEATGPFADPSSESLMRIPASEFVKQFQGFHAGE